MAVRTIVRIALVAAALPGIAGCVTVAEFEKLKAEVIRQRNSGSGGGDDRERLADLGHEIAALRDEVDRLRGRVEVTEHDVKRALDEARAARAAAPGGDSGSDLAGGPAAAGGDAAGPLGSSEEVEAYRAAYAAWRKGDSQTCIDRFRNFLQTYPSSSYADDASFWMADCHFKHGDYKTAILRFDDVVARYPDGGKAPDALYRQGEALLRLGPGYNKAAGKAFERVIKEYPSSARASEAKKQLDLLRSG